MAMLAAKSPYPAGMGSVAGSGSQYASNASTYGRTPVTASRPDPPFIHSPSESEFSENYDAPDSVRNWDEDRVAEWLRSINCSQYIELFRKNNINGENLMEMDQAELKDIGIKKIGDRVRIGSQAKLFRNREYKKASKRTSNRQSLLMLDNPVYTPPSSGSPRPLHSARSVQSSRSDKRMSRQIAGTDFNYAASLPFAKAPSRPESPLVDADSRNARSRQHGALHSPKDSTRKEPNPYFPHSAATSNGRTPGIGTETPQTARFGPTSRTLTVDTPQTARFANHVRASPSTDSSSTYNPILPVDQSWIRVIFDSGRMSVITIDKCRTAEDIILKTLKKGSLNEAHVKNYCFYVLDGTEPIASKCRRLNDTELVRVCNDRMRMERGRLILRKIHTGEPEDEQLRAAANLAIQQQQLQRDNVRENIVLPTSNRSQLKIEKITGESLAAVSYPLSPASARERERHIDSAAKDLERADSMASNASNTSARARKLKQFYGARPPSELITSDLMSYFPDVEKNEIDKTIRMSVRRSRRISRATSRLSMASNFSVASSMRDAPPLPSIADSFLQYGTQAKPHRPLSVMRLGLPGSNYRDSVASSMLEPLDEESPLEPNRKSYVSFGGDSNDRLSVIDPDGNTSSYFDDAGSSLASSGSGGTEAGDSLNKRLSAAIREDDEESDEELTEYLEQDSWENVKYMKGSLIGQGSFGSVYLALHAVTGELMAVKQVEVPSTSGTAIDQKKTNMVEALKHEIGLLRDMKHPNIVQYLGSNSDETHLNIFLEYVPGGSVASMLVNYGPLGEGLIQNFVRQILTGLNYLHSKDIIHRDIKGANILVDNKGGVKISDFGISKRVEASTLLAPSGGKKLNQRVSLQGSVFWMAPEVVRQTAYTRKADIWSLGCLIVEMFTGSHPHPNCTQLQAIFKIGGSGDATPTIPDNAGEEARAFLSRTFDIDHEKRPSAVELLEAPFCNPKA